MACEQHDSLLAPLLPLRPPVTHTLVRCRSANALNETATATSPATQYLPDSGWHHSAVLRNLVGGHTYFYRVGDLTTWSGVFSFLFPQNPASGSLAFGVHIFGDHGYLDSAQRPLLIPAVRCRLGDGVRLRVNG